MLLMKFSFGPYWTTWTNTSLETTNLYFKTLILQILMNFKSKMTLLDRVTQEKLLLFLCMCPGIMSALSYKHCY